MMVKKLRVNEGCHTKKEGFSGLDFDAMLAEVGGDFEELKAIMDARPFNPLEMLDFASWLATNDDYMAQRERKEVNLSALGFSYDFSPQHFLLTSQHPGRRCPHLFSFTDEDFYPL